MDLSKDARTTDVLFKHPKVKNSESKFHAMSKHNSIDKFGVWIRNSSNLSNEKHFSIRDTFATAIGIQRLKVIKA